MLTYKVGPPFVPSFLLMFKLTDSLLIGWKSNGSASKFSFKNTLVPLLNVSLELKANRSSRGTTKEEV